MTAPRLPADTGWMGDRRRGAGLGRANKTQPRYYRCGICDSYHSAEWNGDCRQDDARFDNLDLDARHGRLGWDEIDMPTWDAPLPPRKFYLRRLRLNNGGYDSGGAYWGLGPPLYWACSEDSTIDRYFRARDRNAAKTELRKEFPGAVFFR